MFIFIHSLAQGKQQVNFFSGLPHISHLPGNKLNCLL
tara:strand:+ start:282 stop:392 length:111 start_codon:yes stop_codon:yes gene_type:complete